MIALMQNLGFAAAFVCLLFALHLFRAAPMRKLPARLLAAILLVIAAQSVAQAVLLSVGRPSLAGYVLPALALLVGPLLLFYFKSAASPVFGVTPAQLLHFVPAVLVIIMFVAGDIWIDIDLMILASFGVYTFLLALQMGNGRAMFSHLGTYSSTLFHWLRAAVILMALSFLAELLIYQHIRGGGSLGASVSLLIGLAGKLLVVGFVLLSALQRPSHFDWIYSFGASDGKKLPPEDKVASYQQAIEKLERLVEEEKIFTQHITLETMASRLGVSRRTLSEAINYTFGESYSRRMNGYRVAEAMRLLTESPHLSITEVMFDAGFRTKSTFNREFLAIAGTSPTAFREGKR